MSKLIYIENEGLIFRGSSRAWPSEVWSAKEGQFVAYSGSVPKDVSWGEIISEEEAQNMIKGA